MDAGTVHDATDIVLVKVKLSLAMASRVGVTFRGYPRQPTWAACRASKLTKTRLWSLNFIRRGEGAAAVGRSTTGAGPVPRWHPSKARPVRHNSRYSVCISWFPRNDVAKMLPVGWA